MRGGRKRLAILLGSPLTEDVFSLIGMPYLGRPFDVTIVDCVRWVRSGAEVSFTRYPYEPLVTVEDGGAFDRALAQVAPAYAVDFISKGPYTRVMQDALRRAGVIYVAQRIAPSPLPAARPMASLARGLTLARRVWGWTRRALADANPRSPDVALLAGSDANDYWTAAAGTVLWTSAPDYFRLRDVQRSRADNGGSPTHPKPYALFIDDCLALSLDYAITGRPRPIEPDAYFARLRATFDRIEASFSIPIAIAAHPNGRDIPDYASRFGSRAVYFGATASLSIDCVVALTHYSTAVSYPVLLRKPIVILNARALRGTYSGDAADTLAALLRCPVLSMDGTDAAPAIPQVDEEAYAAYETRYITTRRSDDCHPFEPFVRFAMGCEPA